MLDTEPSLVLEPIGIVHSRVVERRDMPSHGLIAEVEVFPEYRDGLRLIEDNTHLWIVGWFSDAERDQLEIVRPEYISGHRRRGVFGLRSTTRPNSIGMSAVRLLDVQEGRLTLDYLDFLDGTLVLDIKRYSPSWDNIFAARSSRERYLEITEATRLDSLEIDGAKFHGALTANIVAGARLMQHVIQRWQVLPRAGELTVKIPIDPMHGELADALQGMTAATFGSGRLDIDRESRATFRQQARVLTANPISVRDRSLSDVRDAPLEELFTIYED